MDNKLTEQIIGAAIEVHRALGPGLLESIYAYALCHEFDLLGIPYEREKEIDVIYKGKVIKGQRVDIIVGARVVLELKSISKMPEVAIAQTLSYLKATGLKIGLLINFGQLRLVDGIKRVVC